MRVLRVRGVRSSVSCVRRVLTGVGGTSVARMATMPALCAMAMRTMPAVRAMTTVSNVPKLGEPSHRHRGESSAAESEAEAIEVHMSNTTCSCAGW